MDLNMLNLRQFRARGIGGFTLVELMVVILIITILTVIAVPSYTNYVRKSRRTEVKSMLLDLAAREERYMATNGVYSNAVADLGLTGASWPVSTASGYYTIATPVITAASASTSTTAATPATYTITATAAGTQTQDTECNKFIVNNSGQQTSQNSSGTLVTDCW
jgi:type IV pilus assembly protein PilE